MHFYAFRATFSLSVESNQCKIKGAPFPSERKEELFMKQDEELHFARKAIHGNPEAYGWLITRHQEYLYKMAFLYMKNEQDALDLVGTTILKGYQNIRRLKKPQLFRTWITSILINTAKSELKKKDFHDSIEDKKLSAPESGLSAEERLDLNGAIDRLPDKYRTAVILKYFSGFSIQEISCAMNAPEGTVKAYLSRARGELKRMLKEDYFYED